MKKFKSHKIVEAEIIIDVIGDQPSSGDPLARQLVVVIGGEKFDVTGNKNFGKAKRWDYLVRYADGYISYSPRRAFEEGYTEVVDEPRAGPQEPAKGLQITAAQQSRGYIGQELIADETYGAIRTDGPGTALNQQTIKAQPRTLADGLRALLDRQSDEQAMAALEQFGKEGTSAAIADSLIGASFKTPAQSGATFGVALAALKNGQKVARAGWNGRGLAVEMVNPTNSDVVTLPFMCLRLPESATNPFGAAQPWAPSGTDTLAEDWIILAD